MAVIKVLGWVGVALAVAAALLVLVGAFGPLPGMVLEFSAASAKLSPAERIKAETDIRTALMQVVGGVLVVVATVTAWRQMLIARGQQHVGWRVAVTDAFSKAMEQLGDADSVARRLGGVYSLDRVAEDDPDERTRVAEILSAFVREQAVTGSVAQDVAAALTVLARRSWPEGVDLAGARLAGARLPGATLSGAKLAGTDLGSAVLTGATLRGADLTGTDLRKADLCGSDLRETNLTETSLSGATADSATRWPADFVPMSSGVRLR